MNYTDLIEECQDMQLSLEVHIDDDPEIICDRLVCLNVMMARSGKMLADVKRIKSGVISECFKTDFKTIREMSPTMAKMYVEAQCSEAQYLVDWLDRINRSATHHCDTMRSLLSYAKEQLRLTSFGSGT